MDGYRVANCKLFLAVRKKIKEESYKFNSVFRDGGYIILVEKLNKQDKVNPQHILNTTPSLNCCTLSRLFYMRIDTQHKIKAIVEMRKRQATCSLHTDAVASYLNVQITADMYKELSDILT